MPTDQQLWNVFMKTGRIDDYLRYRGIDIYQHTNDALEGDNPHAGHHQRPDHSGKQQYR